ncbi:hypothetical protein [uncultured Cohaesibacter sp.]|uniref:hypothetical protein n=1 Tax=uncultured Cohaesibacter sp. TaxID=1002546 RepID=UPI0029C7768A|nr:hypothetical protein [uncultured Cohaesibacter sp.]
MHTLQWMIVALTALLLPLQGKADEMSDTLAKAESLLTSGQPKAAFEALDTMVESFWQKSPMFVKVATFATNIEGYGLYSERAPIFKRNEPLVVYAEPIGYAYGTNSDGKLNASWNVDFTLTNDGGDTLFQKDDFLTLKLPLGQRNREIHLTLTINLTGMKPGKYVSHYQLKDQNSEKQTEFSLPFEVIE